MKSIDEHPDPALEAAVAGSVAYLGSGEASLAMVRDPYWPKWDSPWWHMTLLWELGLASKIPPAAALGMAQAIDLHYLKFFPLSPADLPEGKDFRRDAPCHCALGTMYQVLCDCGVDVGLELPWVRPWFLKYQLEDGGLNCDERAYAGSRKSSIVSTLPPLEAVLLHTHRPFTEEETRFLDRGARYLIAHKLFRSADGGRVICDDWLKLCFPRFYEYDLLRGLSFLKRWARTLGRPLPAEAVDEARELLAKSFPDGRLSPQRLSWDGAKTCVLDEVGRTRAGEDRPASTFALLLETSRLGTFSARLTESWAGA